MARRILRGATLLAGLAAAGAASAAEPALKNKAPLTVLGNDTMLRTFWVYRTPVVVTPEGKLKPGRIPRKHRGEMTYKTIPDYQSPLPADGWQAVGFDDSNWRLGKAPLEKYRGQATGRRLTALHTATRNSMICARAKFIVSDPGKADGLRLSLKYVGGAAVFLNGKELARNHLPDGELKPDTLAEAYPDDLYVEPGNKYLQWEKDNPQGFARRYRYLKDVAVPAGRLRTGVNVLAVQLFRAPVNEPATRAERRPYSGMYRVPGLWAYAALRELRLTAPRGAAVQPNVGRPPGVQVWNCAPYETISAFRYGDPGDRLQPIEVVALRNGVFSGRFVVSSDRAIAGLKVAVSELAQDDGPALPAEAVRLRYGRPAKPSESWRPAHLFDGLDEAIPSTIPVYKGRKANEDAGAVAPIWLTVRVPKDARAGTYKGEVTVRAKGLEPTRIPVRFTVYGWTLPDPIDWRVRHLNVLSPYSLAKRYGVEYWSERHFELIAGSMRLMAAINARRVSADLAVSARTRSVDIENAMVHWIKTAGGYRADFSVLEQYLDVVEKTMTKPLPLRVNCWGDFNRKKRDQWVSCKVVAVRDPETGELSPLANPPPGSEENYRFWKPVLDELRERIEKRGWWHVTAIGHQSYCWAPHPGTVHVAKRIWPDAAWSYTSHSGRLGGWFKGAEKDERMPIRYSECVWTQGKFDPRGYRRLLEAGRGKKMWNSVSRNQHKDDSPLLTLRRKPEEMILRGHDGLGYLCSDFLPVPNPKRKGRFYKLEANHGGVRGASTRSLLAAGSRGPIATGRYEMFRQGSQICEAIFFLERALEQKRITGELAERVDAYLTRRGRVFIRGWHAGRRERDRTLFVLAGEVASKAAPN
ncbi:MAG: glycoside hydrolase domain-containing protein [bacterium]